MDEMKCPQCGKHMEFLACAPAHITNLYCPDYNCGYEGWGGYKRELGRKLVELRQKAISEGMDLWDADRIAYEVRERRGEVALGLCKICGKAESELSEPCHKAAQSQPVPDQCPTEFVRWLSEQMPAGTVIADPEWWAPRIHRALLAAATKPGGE